MFSTVFVPYCEIFISPNPGTVNWSAKDGTNEKKTIYERSFIIESTLFLIHFKDLN